MSNMNIMAGLGVAVREFQLTTGESDYGLYIDGKVALLPFHNPKLREILLRPEHQVIDKFTRDQLLMSSFDPEAKQRAETLVTSFRQFIEDNKAEIEAISILYSRPHRARCNACSEGLPTRQSPPLPRIAPTKKQQGLTPIFEQSHYYYESMLYLTTSA